MTVQEFVNAYKAKRFINTQQGVNEKAEWIRNELEIKSYIPFREKRKIAEMIVEQNITEVDGIKKYDSINGYISLIVTSIAAHTTLRFGDNPISDYDLLAENDILADILIEFDGSHKEIEILLNMALDMELEDNEINVMIGSFLNKVSELLDGVGGVLKDKLDSFDLSDILGADFKQEGLAELSRFLNKIK